MANTRQDFDYGMTPDRLGPKGCRTAQLTALGSDALGTEAARA